ncbi:MAG: HAD hydrolase-like protein [Balneolales bacterium]|nr:HAD hydrolase-like protein [Balneolales bacterium]
MAASHPWVILFDIDGTLITVNRSFNRPLLRSIVDDLGINYAGVETDPFSGRTDHDILSSFLVNHNLDENLYSRLKSEYLGRLSSRIEKNHITRHPYIDDAIQYFSASGCILGLLTGNFPSAAKRKLDVAEVDLNYSIGAFGEFHRERNMLPQLAVDQVRELINQEPDPQRFVIIGDTPRDIQCAKHAGMKCVSVTTGKFSGEELAEYNPDLIIDSMKDPEIWFGKITG